MVYFLLWHSFAKMSKIKIWFVVDIFRFQKYFYVKVRASDYLGLANVVNFLWL
jgi:hypothetical protein